MNTETSVLEATSPPLLLELVELSALDDVDDVVDVDVELPMLVSAELRHAAIPQPAVSAHTAHRTTVAS
jgi:hypothetical protein